MATVGGFVKNEINSFLKGQEPRDPRSVAAFLDALAEGGGLGIIGDFAFCQTNRFGGGLLDTLAGPVLGDAAELFKI